MDDRQEIFKNISKNDNKYFEEIEKKSKNKEEGMINSKVADWL